MSAGVDQLTSVTEAGVTRSFAYNADGDTTGYGDKTLGWDGWGQHTGGSFAGQSVGYQFDAGGFRRQRTSGTVTTRYLLGGLFETDTTGAITLADVDGPGGDLAHYSGPPTIAATVTYRYYNGHGDLAATVDTTGSRTAAYTYDPFGGPLESPPANSTSERWTGRWDKKHDATSGLIEMGVRPYDPALGRFLAVDPIDGGALNNYDYAGQDPINMYDSDGRCYGPLMTFCIRAGVPLLLHAARWLGIIGASTTASAKFLTVAMNDPSRLATVSGRGVVPALAQVARDTGWKARTWHMPMVKWLSRFRIRNTRADKR